jgi:cyclopropane fatty-acyl-phospholipid synthase-like methyltransferase
MTTDAHDWDRAYAGDAAPPWDIGRPQPVFEAVAAAGRLRGRVLDIGCGTGEHALLAAERGADAYGIDLSARAIEQAKAKATRRGLDARFDVADALTLAAPGAPYDVVIDSGVFHVFDDADRATYVDVLRRMLRPGGVVFLMCFSDRQPGDWGPRRVSEDELRTAFADGWGVDLERATMSVNPIEDVTRVQAWFATISRLAAS